MKGLKMIERFKKKPEPQRAAPEPPEKSPEQIAAEKIIAKAERLRAVSQEAAMWRAFATGCVARRHITEELSAFVYVGMPHYPRLSVFMDDDTAAIWKDFALRMAEDRERRIKDLIA